MAADDLDDWAARARALVAAAPGRVSLGVRTCAGRAWGLEEDRAVPAASTVKVPVLLAVLAACAEGRLRLDGWLRLPAERVGGGGPLALLPSVAQVRVRDALGLMVSLSDNDATNALIDVVGQDAVARLLAAVPTRHTRLRRRMMDAAAVRRGLENETSAADLVATLVALREGRLLPAAVTAVALEVLRTQPSRSGLAAFLPASVTVASKTGELFGVRHEVALLERGGRWVVVAVAATDLHDGAVDRGAAVLPAFATIGELAQSLL